VIWRIGLLGGLRAERGNQIVTRFDTRKTAALLAYLAFFRDRTHPRELLAELLWPEEAADATRVRFRQTLSGVRRALEPPGIPPGSVLVADRAGAHLSTETVDTDVAELERLVRRARSAGSPTERAALLKQALELYRGELLPGLYEEWILPERRRIAELHLGALGDLADALVEAGELPGAIRAARRAVEADPLREESHCRLMHLHALSGSQADAVRQYRELEAGLKELRVAPGAAARALLAEIQASASRPEMRDTGYEIRDSSPTPSRIAHPTSRIAYPESRIPATDQEFAGGAVPLASPFYVERPADAQFRAGIRRTDSLLLVKGPRQVGKTSLLARGLHYGREQRHRVVLTDFQTLTPEQMASTEALFLALAWMIADQLSLDQDPEQAWNPRRGWNVNFQRYLQDLLGELESPLVWAMDEVDRLFSYPFAGEVFGLFRAWHNARSLSPDAPWSRLTLAIAYATEATLFITDLNQSPFNVGTRLTLEDFTLEQVAELNRRHATHSASSDLPLPEDADLARFFALVGGHPYLVRRGLHALAAEGVDLEALETRGPRGDGPFGDHLRRLLTSLSQNPELAAAMRRMLTSGTCRDAESFYRLRSAGLVLGDCEEEVRPRCRLYRLFFERSLS
jgi:DNA-binding SARP family transcriptional activator